MLQLSYIYFIAQISEFIWTILFSYKIDWLIFLGILNLFNILFKINLQHLILMEYPSQYIFQTNKFCIIYKIVSKRNKSC